MIVFAAWFQSSNNFSLHVVFPLKFKRVPRTDFAIFLFFFFFLVISGVERIE